MKENHPFLSKQIVEIGKNGTITVSQTKNQHLVRLEGNRLVLGEDWMVFDLIVDTPLTPDEEKETPKTSNVAAKRDRSLKRPRKALLSDEGIDGCWTAKRRGIKAMHGERVTSPTGVQLPYSLQAASPTEVSAARAIDEDGPVVARQLFPPCETQGFSTQPSSTPYLSLPTPKFSESPEESQQSQRKPSPRPRERPQFCNQLTFEDWNSLPLPESKYAQAMLARILHNEGRAPPLLDGCRLVCGSYASDSSQ